MIQWYKFAGARRSIYVFRAILERGHSLGDTFFMHIHIDFDSRLDEWRLVGRMTWVVQA